MNKTKLKINFIILVCSLIVACSNETKTKKGNNQVTLIFENAPSTWKSDETNCMVLSETEYVDDNFIQHQFIPDPSKQFDTLVISTNRKLVEIKHSYKTLDHFSYLFHKGDTVVFRYNEKTPVVNVTNRDTKTLDLNYDLYKREKLTPNDFPAYVKFQQPIAFADYSKGFNGADEKVFNKAIEMFAIEMTKERTLLDSLKKNNFISDEIFNFYNTQLFYQQKNIQLQSQLGLHSIKPLYKKLTPEDFNIQLGYSKELGWINGGNILDSKNDSLLYFSYYNEVINWIYFQYLSRKVGRVKSTNYVNNIATAGSNLPNYITLADTIVTDNLLSKHSKNILLFRNIQNVIENNSIGEANNAFKKFKEEVNDSALVNFIRERYSFDTDSIDKTNDLKLISMNSEHISYNELIKKHYGKVIYLDFWGSGCPPCIQQFKFSSNIKELYSGKNLVQIYISSEPDKKRWETACKKYNLEHESYFVENRYASSQLENMNIKYIPHYLIYDKQGKLVNGFAPRPSEKELITLLDNYLLKKE